MKRVLLLLVAAAALLAFPAHALADAAYVDGGGNGSWDPFDVTDASQFGMGIQINGDGTASGHFECLMAGRSTFPGFQYMAVTGPVSLGTVDLGARTAHFSGIGTLMANMVGSDETTKTDVIFEVDVKEGDQNPGPSQGVLHLSGVVPIGGPPIFTFPPEYVTAGQITIH